MIVTLKARICSSCASRCASCARRYDILDHAVMASSLKLCNGMYQLFMDLATLIRSLSNPTIWRHPSWCWIRLFIQFDVLSWKPRMKGDMSNPWTFETMVLGIELDLECWMRRSSWRALLSTIWFSGSTSWRLITCVVLLDKASAQWGQGFEAVYQMHSFLERSDTWAIMVMAVHKGFDHISCVCTYTWHFIL